MRTKIRVDGKWYRPVPWTDPTDECCGCAFEQRGANCYNTAANGSPCDDGNEFQGMIFIRHTKEAMAEYVLKRMGVTDEPELE